MDEKSILIVDDEALIRLSLKLDFVKEGFRTTAVDGGESALIALKEGPYDILLTDYLLEDIDGIELMKKAKELQPAIKVIVFSGFDAQNSEDGVLDAGADAFVQKPIDFDDLLKRISELLKS